MGCTQGGGGTTCSGRCVAAAMRVMEIELVLDARMPSGLTTCWPDFLSESVYHRHPDNNHATVTQPNKSRPGTRLVKLAEYGLQQKCEV